MDKMNHQNTGSWSMLVDMFNDGTIEYQEFEKMSELKEFDGFNDFIRDKYMRSMEMKLIKNEREVKESYDKICNDISAYNAEILDFTVMVDAMKKIREFLVLKKLKLLMSRKSTKTLSKSVKF